MERQSGASFRNQRAAKDECRSTVQPDSLFLSQAKPMPSLGIHGKTVPIEQGSAVSLRSHRGANGVDHSSAQSISLFRQTAGNEHLFFWNSWKNSIYIAGKWCSFPESLRRKRRRSFNFSVYFSLSSTKL
ncbi:hypothetical protein AVEN_21321-1 [Araneus ventricosus]|uniref:Uncharacterized protein n=1 Tax=Araneus ventricosus TaxID=182803 RepID=A0A4Y2VW09_ARAVE|nr:hypothetical protein AVEN_21321-1 [Araneus ventricosus]